MYQYQCKYINTTNIKKVKILKNDNDKKNRKIYFFVITLNYVNKYFQKR